LIIVRAMIITTVIIIVGWIIRMTLKCCISIFCCPLYFIGTTTFKVDLIPWHSADELSCLLNTFQVDLIPRHSADEFSCLLTRFHDIIFQRYPGTRQLCSPRNYIPDQLRADIWHGPHQGQVGGQTLDAPLGVILSHARVCMNFLYKGKVLAAPCPALPCIALWFACERAFLVALGVTLCHARTCMNYPCKGTVVAAPCPALPCIALWFTCERVHCE